MLLSQLLGERYKEKPSDATLASYIYLLRGGYIRQVANGIFTGYTKEYVPVRIRVPGRRTGDIVPAVLGAFDGTRCAAQPV